MPDEDCLGCGAPLNADGNCNTSSCWNAAEKKNIGHDNER